MYLPSSSVLPNKIVGTNAAAENAESIANIVKTAIPNPAKNKNPKKAKKPNEITPIAPPANR